MSPFKLYESLKAIIHSSRAHFIEKAELLYKLYDKKTYKKAIGEESWTSFLAEPDISIAASKDYIARKIYKKFVVDLGIPKQHLWGIDSIKLDVLANLVTKKDVKEWLGKAQALSRSDFLKVVKGEVVDCQHKNIKEYPASKKCQDCGEKLWNK